MSLGNFFGPIGAAVGQIGKFFPQGVQGYRDSIKDNWDDMKNYAQVYGSQLTNLFDTMTLPSDYKRAFSLGERSLLSLDQDRENRLINHRMFPGLLAQADAFTGMAPHIFPLQQLTSWYQMQMLLNAMMSGQLPISAMAGLNRPSLGA